ncbi:MAG: DUF4268 domain-containing protein [Planctomycetes bacterium]|nr:DUF4268 domain-containing protein [Planctomycetota bacterium]
MSQVDTSTAAGELGALTEVELRHAWAHEASAFTPWLAQEENLALLAKALGLELELEGVEVPVGPYSADILARDVGTGEYVVIENQLEKTNHDHLGKIITYASVLDAGTVVWIASNFTDEHRKALDWLNNRTDDELQFYGICIELWRIGKSPPAPRFNVVSRPAKIVKPIGGGGTGGELTETRKLQLQLWTEVREALQTARAAPSLQTPRPQYWYEVAIGRSYFVLSLIANTHENRIGIRVYMNHRVADQALALLEKEREQIENEIGAKLLWNPNPENRDKIIALYRQADLAKKDEWPGFIDWITNNVVAFRKVFQHRIKKLDLTTTSNEEREA